MKTYCSLIVILCTCLMSSCSDSSSSPSIPAGGFTDYCILQTTEEGVTLDKYGTNCDKNAEWKPTSILAPMPAYPNPFTTLTYISFALATTANVTITLTNKAGTVVLTTGPAATQAGAHTLAFSATGSPPIPPGIYQVNFSAQELHNTGTYPVLTTFGHIEVR